ncbi:MAG: NAD(+)/NADH kinase [Deltaproteobacteria bacterium]|jgi:nicotinate (nicotinamide) nucleotide adenylyltransferase|nr:NAD(+)/NADH kinase [Deltaproteobacteria bacterium]MBW2536420.1 NAD(+)/NADH kinase [Deltaproteobacteria bacterium]
MSRTIAVFGGSFNPPGAHHRSVARALADHFDEVVVVPCGPRPDKPITDDVPPIFRAAMTDLTFRGLERVRVDLFDLEASTFTRTFQLEERYRSVGEVWHVIGGDLLVGADRGESAIHREWAEGERIWRELRFAVVNRPGFPFEAQSFPPQHRVVSNDAAGSSSQIRTRVFGHESIADLVTPEVAAYMERHNLYRGMRPPHTTRLPLGDIRPRVVVDPHSDEARCFARRWPEHDPVDPNLIVVVGGDGTMLRAIRSEWRRRLPFYGINTGHLGFLLNQGPPEGYGERGLVLEHLPLLWVQVERRDGSRRTALAFNDAWVERASGQTAWLQVLVDGRERLDRLVADGALIATAAGSTCYARAMGASPLPLNTPALLMVGSNVLRPAFFQPAVLHQDAEMELRTLDPDKRPLRGYIDGVDQGEVVGMRARVSNIAAVELAFDPEYDAAEKLARIQFPLVSDGIG